MNEINIFHQIMAKRKNTISNALLAALFCPFTILFSFFIGNFLIKDHPLNLSISNLFAFPPLICFAIGWLIIFILIKD